MTKVITQIYLIKAQSNGSINPATATNHNLLLFLTPFFKIIWFLILHHLKNLNPIHDGGGSKRSPSSFPPVTSTNVGISPQNFLTFSFYPFTTLLQYFKAIPSTSPKLLNLNQEHPSKNWFFWLNPYNIEVMITCLIEMLVLPIFFLKKFLFRF